MQANIYAALHWTPEVFWNLTMDQYIAAMYGIYLINSSPDETTKGHLSSDDNDHLRAMLAKDKEANG